MTKETTKNPETEDLELEEEEHENIDPLDEAIQKSMQSEADESDEEEAEEEADDTEEDEEETEETSASEEEEEEADEDDDEEGSDLDDDAPLDNWSEDLQAKYAEIKDPAAKQLVKELSAALQTGVQQRQQEAQTDLDYAREMRSVFNDQDRAQFQAQGRTEQQVVSQLVGLMRWSQQDPAGYIKAAMQSLGVTPEQIQPTPDPLEQTFAGMTQEQLADLDPGVVQLLQAQNQQIAQLSQNVNQQFNQFQVDAQRQAWEQQMSSFATATDEAGNLKWPHFEALKTRIQNLMSADTTIPLDHKGLETAYKSVILTDPVLGPAAQALFLKAEQPGKKEERKRKKKALKKAKNAAPPVKTKRPSSDPKTRKYKGEDALDRATADAIAQHSG